MKILFIQEYVPSYRMPFFASLSSFPDVDLTLLCGSTGEEEWHNIVSVDNRPQNVNWSVCAIKRMIIGSANVIWFPKLFDIIRSLKPEIIITQGGKRVIQNHGLLSLQKRLGYRLFLFQQAREYGKRKKVFVWLDHNILRNYWSRFAAGIIVYTEEEKRRLIADRFAPDKIHSADNAIDTKAIRQIYRMTQNHAHLSPPYGDTASPCGASMAVIGRVIAGKKVDKAIDYYMDILRVIDNLRLDIIGDGPEASRLKDITAHLKQVYWAGAIYDDAIMAQLLGGCRFVFCPGYAGLNILHSFAHGQPFVTFASEYHKPEIAYLTNGANGLILENGRRADAINAMCKLILDSDYREKLVINSLRTAEEFSIERMAEKVYRSIKQA